MDCLVVSQCCCCSLKKGSATIGWLQAVGAGLMLLRSIYLLINPVQTINGVPNEQFTQIVFETAVRFGISSLISLILALILLIGVLQNKPKCVLAYAAINLGLLVLGILGVICVMVFVAATTKTLGGVVLAGVFIGLLIAAGLQLYFISVVYSYYRSMIGADNTSERRSSLCA